MYAPWIVTERNSVHDNLRWRIASPALLACREWDGQAVMHDQRTGATHMLGPGATAVWSALATAGGPSTVTSLAAALQPPGGAGGEAATVDAVAAVVADLARLGVVEAVAP
jgi:PqqD family protein of HPr-rel-A system